MSLHIPIRVALLVSATGVLTQAVRAQQAPCTYDACALRVKDTYTFFATRTCIVQGASDTQVACLGFSPPNLALFAERSDSAGHYYASFRSAHTSASWLGLVATTLSVASFLAFAKGGVESNFGNSGDSWVVWGYATLVLNIGFSVAGDIRSGQARDRLSKAIWWHNRGLLPSP